MKFLITFVGGVCQLLYNIPDRANVSSKSAGRVHSQTAQERAHRCLLDDQKINLIANWICRSGTVVLVSKPATPVGAPVPSKMSELSGTVGRAKLGWFMMLNISTRNCTLKFSEILLMRLFLNTEKSKLLIPGPTMMFRPALPRRLKHCSEAGSTGPPKLGGAGSQFVFQKAASGAVGTEKHCVLM